MARQIRLYGKVFIKGDIKALSGLHIGGGDSGLSIGGIDNPVIRNARTNRPYIPGSSLKGKMRSLLGDLPLGDHRYLSQKEVEALKRATGSVISDQ